MAHTFWAHMKTGGWIIFVGWTQAGSRLHVWSLPLLKCQGCNLKHRCAQQWLPMCALWTRSVIFTFYLSLSSTVFSSNDCQVATWNHCMQLARDSYLSATRRCLKAFLLRSFSNMVWMCWVGGGKTRSPLQFTTDQLLETITKVNH